MKRVGSLILLPIMVFGLEQVNLIKNSGFEEDNDIWRAWTKSDEYPSVSLSNRHDNQKAYTGLYSGSQDTRPDPGKTEFNYLEYSYLTQTFCVEKPIMDIDSVFFPYCVYPLNNDILQSVASDVFLHFDLGFY